MLPTLPLKTRKELPSCEAIDVRKVNIGNIVRAVTKFKTDTNLKVHTESKFGTDLNVFTDFEVVGLHGVGFVGVGVGDI